MMDEPKEETMDEGHGLRVEEETVGTSPVVSTIRPTVAMDFSSCLHMLLGGAKCRREEWPKDGTYIVLRNEKLMIWTRKDGQLHPLTVSAGDIVGEDWVTVGGKGDLS